MIGATIGPWINQLEARNSTDVWMFQVKLFGVEILVKLTKYHLSGQESWLLEINPTNTSQIWSYDMMKVFDSGESKFFSNFSSHFSRWTIDVNCLLTLLKFNVDPFLGGGSWGLGAMLSDVCSPVDLPLLVRWLRAKWRAGCSRSCQINSRTWQ